LVTFLYFCSYFGDKMNEIKNERISGRGAQINTHNRFDKHNRQGEDIFRDEWEEEEEADKTEYIRIYPKTIINKVESPDVGLTYSMNPYQGCEHGCIYCYARSSHNYWGYSAGLDFERKILYKENAPELLAETFEKKSWKGECIMLSGNTDCYQPIERKLGITRKILRVCHDYRNPVGIITKNSLIERDIDILAPMAAQRLCQVLITVNCADESVRRLMEPRTASTSKRIQTIRRLSDAGIPVTLMISPIIPSVNDRYILDIMKMGADAGAITATYVIIRLNGDVATLFKDWIKKTFPDKAERVIHQIEDIHGGTTEDYRYGTRMRGEGHFAEIIRQQFMIGRKKYFGDKVMPALDSSRFRRFGNGQMSLFDEIDG